MLKTVSGPIARPVKTVIYGTEGVGKSTLASQFPEPLFIDIEGGTAQMNVTRLVPPKTWESLLDLVNEVAQDPESCRTLVLDTADRAEALCIEYVCRKNNQKSIEGFGYGRGYTFLGEEWAKLMAAFDKVLSTGINVTIIAHAKQRKIELPEQTGSFDHWEMKLTKQVAPLLKEWADLLLFLNYKTYVVVTDTNSRKAQGGKRVMYTSHNPVYDAKNRHGLPEEMELSFDGIAKIFGKPELSVPVSSPHVQLTELMEEADITDYELQNFIASRGKQDIETPIYEYPEDFVKGYCLKYWEKIKNAIYQMKETENE